MTGPAHPAPPTILNLAGVPLGAQHLGVPEPLTPKWSWSCRFLAAPRRCQVLRTDTAAPRVGDLALVQVVAIGHHTRIATAAGEKLRLYPGDVLAGVFGNRYATDAFEGEVGTTADLHLLTDAGMIGTVRSRHLDTGRPTALRFLGYLADESGQRLNLKALCRMPAVRVSAQPELCPLGREGAAPAESLRPHGREPENVLLVVGTAMNSGKTTVAAKLVKALLHRGVRVAACKLTGSVCQRDRGEFSAAGAHVARDFSDYGFPSTYLIAAEELLGLFEAMLADAAAARPDIVVMEIADGVLQREVKLLLSHEAVRRRVRGVVLTAPCSASALFGVAQVEAQGHAVVAVSGRITNSPLFMREFAAHSPVRLASSAGDGAELADLVLRHCQVVS
jgi:hypothetical protein